MPAIMTWISYGLTALLLLVAFDAVWLTAIAPTSRRVIAGIQGSPLQVRWIPAALVYLLIAAGIAVFAVAPPTSGSMEAAGRGALLGLVIYGVYDLTNHATLNGYPLSYALADIVWGTFLCGSVAAATYWITAVGN